ncbi:hypothetical protein [Luethyella okanaganae]|uniref:Uncharacterized protein n=1 Tax=Luethyella okanaganae TaxID=69372 RepID=A0ABW1VKG1_9MICO
MSEQQANLAKATLALLAEDRVVVAARVLVLAFTPLLDRPFPSLTGARLAEAVASVGGASLSKWSWSMYRSADAQLARLILELEALWEAAGLTRRSLGEMVNEVALLRRGEELLRGQTPTFRVEESLRAHSR